MSSKANQRLFKCQAHLTVAEEFAACLGRHAFAFDEGVVGEGCPQGLAPANSLLEGLTGGGHGHCVEPPTLLVSDGIPISKGIRNIVGRGFRNGPGQDAEFFAQRWMHQYWLCRGFEQLVSRDNYFSPPGHSENWVVDLNADDRIGQSQCIEN